mmetsp:Transcript_35083/g.112766  ORF Transcript_35083/g.112766 Transcript_35083/m.112766 type:complete len:96 (+) Transcript_35083:128-415(+)
MGTSPDTRSPLPTAPPYTLLTHASYGVFWRTPARWSSDMPAPPSGSAEGGSAAWPEVDGPAEPEDGAAEAAASELDGSGEVEDGAADIPLAYFSM